MFCSINNKACLGISSTNSRRLMGPRRQQPPSCQLALSWLAWSLANSPTVIERRPAWQVLQSARRSCAPLRGPRDRGQLPRGRFACSEAGFLPRRSVARRQPTSSGAPGECLQHHQGTEPNSSREISKALDIASRERSTLVCCPKRIPRCAKRLRRPFHRGGLTTSENIIRTRCAPT